jgi:hypothetical protein
MDALASGMRDGEYSESESSRGTLSVNGYPKTKTRSTLGAVLFVFGYY